ncbi:MAG: hypothetical protein Q9207_004059 [Kuettlingeria erythrocarpa]
MHTTKYENFKGQEVTITTFYEGDEDPPTDTIVTKVRTSFPFPTSKLLSSRTRQIYRSPTFTYTFYQKFYRELHETTKDTYFAVDFMVLHYSKLNQLSELLDRRMFLPAPTAEGAQACWERETGKLRLKLLGEWLPQFPALLNPLLCGRSN